MTNKSKKKSTVRNRDLTNIQLLVMDVDGVLTDGTVSINDNGTEGKIFNLQDGHGIRMWQRAGLKAALLSGRFSQATKHRAEQLGIDYCIQNCFEKLPALKKLLEEVGVSAKSTAYIGDDLMDLPVITYVGFGVAVANAVDEVKDAADFITLHRGGEGSVREVIEYILKNTGKWKQLVKKYQPDSKTI